MSNTQELKEEEREVLSSIYEGDECFRQIDTNTFQYKYGKSDTFKSFLVEIKWGENYPEELPIVNMNTFYNEHIVPALKEKVVNLINAEAEQFLGMSMTYSLFEYVKEKFDELIEEQPEHVVESIDKLCISGDSQQQESSKKEKKEQLTKAQKRRAWNKLDSKGEKPRGWDWVDVVKHLSQTGSKDESPPVT